MVYFILNFCSKVSYTANHTRYITTRVVPFFTELIYHRSITQLILLDLSMGAKFYEYEVKVGGRGASVASDPYGGPSTFYGGRMPPPLFAPLDLSIVLKYR